MTQSRVALATVCVMVIAAIVGLGAPVADAGGEEFMTWGIGQAPSGAS